MAFSKFYAFDALAGVLKRDVGLAALTTDGYVGTQWDQGAAALTDCVLVINVESIDVAGTDEIYNFRVVGSNVADRSDGEVLAERVLGHITAIPGPETVLSARLSIVGATICTVGRISASNGICRSATSARILARASTTRM